MSQDLAFRMSYEVRQKASRGYRERNDSSYPCGMHKKRQGYRGYALYFRTIEAR